MVNRGAVTSIEAAAAVTNVDVLTIRKWAADGLLQIESRGAIEFVSVHDVNDLASWATSRKKSAQRGTIRGLLREAPLSEAPDFSELHKLARDRID